MKHLFFTTALMLFVGACYANNDLQLEVYYDQLSPSVARAGSHTIEVGVVLKNTGKNVLRVPTRNLGPSIARFHSGSMTVTFTRAFDEFLGARVKYAECDFAPVVVKPGEVAVIAFMMDVPEGQTLDDVVFEYAVAPDIADEYGFWSGRIKSRLRTRGGAK